MLTSSLKRKTKTFTKVSATKNLLAPLKRFFAKLTIKQKTVADFLFGFYKLFLNPILGNACCYYPSCSQYARESFHRHNAFKALALTVWRILRCHPLSRGGFDPVPLPREFKREQ
ncbi:MAG: membrane protein insertion efficiency factor YidD [Bdellovibrionales bacterium]|nr:membrane protein insertion efficiency factor YidD [Bdellovibrionales bacterium]